MSYTPSQTFFQLDPEYTDPKAARYHVVPVPYEGTVCFLRGTAQGPAAILDVSEQMEYFDEETLQEYFRAGIATHPPILSAKTPQLQMKRIYETVKKLDLFSKNRFPIFLGGEHSITAPIVKAARERYEELTVLQIDAHADLRHEFTGGVHSHAAVMRRVLEMTPHLVQVGIRSFSVEEYQQCPEQIRRIVTPKMVQDDFQFALDRILYGLKGHVYITIDMDGFDPSFAPGVGTPEPGGLSWRQVTAILKRVFQEKQVIGADLVETMPLGGENIITEFLAARLVGKLMAYDYAKRDS
ncbi:MAG: agmatinase [Planctomycetaceae bacterium]|nr:agmatinase [Planctomycetaceae bacterium]MCL2305503.1 agmatinase [Planctomycetaceae bacterium]